MGRRPGRHCRFRRFVCLFMASSRGSSSVSRVQYMALFGLAVPPCAQTTNRHTDIVAQQKPLAARPAPIQVWVVLLEGVHVVTLCSRMHRVTTEVLHVVKRNLINAY